jgi:thiamine-monophosphate kinase
MRKSEDNLIAWIASRYPADRPAVAFGIGDDLAGVRAPSTELLVGTDMLMDGVHFDAAGHSPEQIGRKALAVNLSDCAAMAVRPLWAVVSVALPDSWSMEQAQGLFLGMEALARAQDCAIVGGDTNSWPRPLVVNVAIMAAPWEGIAPVRRNGMAAGDAVWVTGRLGGSRLGHHLDFEPRVDEAHLLAQGLGPALHAMIDLSDGLSTDGHRLAAASGVGIEFDQRALEAVLSDAALRAAGEDGRSALAHLLDDGEDYELLLAVDQSGPAEVALPCPWARIGVATEERGLWLRGPDGGRVAVQAGGWEHWKDEG